MYKSNIYGSYSFILTSLLLNELHEVDNIFKQKIIK